MGLPPKLDPNLGLRLDEAMATADRETEVGIQRVRGWCLVVALVQTALYPGQFWYLAWGAMALLLLNWAWVRWALAATDGPRVSVVGVVAMASDTLAAIMIMANLMASPDDPVQLLPLALAVEAAVRWGRPGGIVGGVAGGLLLTLWSWGTHYRDDLDLPFGYAAFRFGVVVLIGAIVGHAVRESRRQRRAAEAVFHASRDVMATFRLDGALVAANPATAQVLGFEPDELAGLDRPLFGEGPAAVGGPLVAGDGGPQRVVRQVPHRDGHLVWLELDLVPDPAAGLVYAIGRDVSDRSRVESELRHRVGHDGLTGAWNRDSLVSYLHRMLSRGYLPGLVFVDLDRFKDINDGHGHLVGDAVIVELARRLADATGQEGSLARYAGDEFCIAVDDPDDVDLVAERTRAAFVEPFDVAGAVLSISGSVGAARARSGDSPDALVHRADQDMYRVKHAGQLPG